MKVLIDFAQSRYSFIPSRVVAASRRRARIGGLLSESYFVVYGTYIMEPEESERL